MITTKQIAELAGVSRRTVDRVIHQRGIVKPETEQRIRRIVEELSYQPNLAGKALAAGKKKLRIAFCSPKGQQYVIYENIRKGVAAKKAELEQLGVHIVSIEADRDHPPSPQELDRLVAEFDCDGLVVVPGRDALIRALMDKARDQGIPMVFYNVDDQSHERLCHVGCDYAKSGRMAAGLATMCLSAEHVARLAILTVGEETSSGTYPSYMNRVEGFRSEIRETSPNVEIVGAFFLGHDVFDAYERIKEILKEHPDLELVYLVNPGDYSACRAIRKLAGKRRIRIITNDLTTEVMPYLKDGTVSATISQDPERQGSVSLQILFDWLVWGKRPEQDIQYTDLHIYLPQSL